MQHPVPHNIFTINLQSEQETANFKAALKDTSIDGVQIIGDLNVEATKKLSRIIWHHDKLAHVFKKEQPRSSQRLMALLYSPFIWGVPSTEGIPLKHIIIENGTISPGAVDILKSAISDRIFSKTILSLKNCKISDKLFKQFINRQLLGEVKSLTLSDNLLGNDSVRHLKKVLNKQMSLELRHIDLQNNLITEEGANEIEKMLVENSKILTLNLSGNKISEKSLNSINAHLADNKKIQVYRKAVKNNVLDLSVIDVNDVDDALIRCVAKLLKEDDYHQVQKIILPDELMLSQSQINALETALLQNTSITDIHSRKVDHAIFQSKSTVVKMLTFNRKVKGIIGNNLNTISLPRLALYMAATGVAVSLFSGMLATVGLTTLSSLTSAVIMPVGILGGLSLLVGNLLYNARFEKKLNALRNEQGWEEADYDAARDGLSCLNSYSPYFSLNAYKPAAYLAYQLGKDEELDILPDSVQKKLSV